ncbi:(Fe-S)-binding protein [Blastococcus mobilis]|uniref:Glycolate oxidase iron-sulfur subunit n=1 Tax=Blastococcus mobilis TaxID=1938746 RepID=A0A239AG13_9ACTN|nr:(Fe-S)-binding protein [Blastococcus mobilis]SNR94575.1 glycolate oxidase iron-sulfur subunit [Blastococcus mobilis]
MTGPQQQHMATPPGRGIFDPALLDRCISCGFCLPACPTYAVSKNEASSPRGRITLMRALETGRLDEDDPRLREESSFCLGCRACEPVCPAGVQYGDLLEEWRDHQWRGRRRPPPAQALMMIAERTALLRMMGLVRRHARTAAPAQTSLMLGCFERGLFPGVSRAVRTLLPDIAVPPHQGCCGALHAHNGESEKGRELARTLGETLPGTIVTTAGGCAAHLAGVLGRDRVQELSEHLAKTGATPVGEVKIEGRRARVAIQDSCHLRNGLRVFAEPRALISAVADFVPVQGDDSCCGSAGTYSLLRPRDSKRILAPKLDAYEAAGVDYVVTVNPGCQRQLHGNLRRRGSAVHAVHLADLLAAAAGGRPLPRGRRWRVPQVRVNLRRRLRRRGASGGTAGWSA